jgi:hypothetical protein
MKALVMAATALLLGVPVAAQQHGQAAQHQGHAEGATMMAHCMEKMGGPQPAMLLAHRAELELTGEQVQRLEALHQQMKTQMMEQHGPEHAQHAQQGQHAQHAQHAQRAQEGQHAQHGSMQMDPEKHAKMQAAHAAFAAQAAALLTDAQRARLGQLVEEGMKHEHGAATGHGEGGAHGGMEHCPMMKKGGGAHGAAGGGQGR